MAAAVFINKLWTELQNGDGRVTVHRDLDLSVEPGDLLALVGASGSGKSTLLRQIVGLTPLSRGAITVLGQPAGHLGMAASRVGMMFQQGALYSAFNVLQNIAFPLRERGQLPAALVRDAALLKLSMVGLEPDVAHKMPAELSGGMIKRVALARALIMDPPLLLLDEPTAGLDPDAADAFCTLLRSLHNELELTVLMITHDLDTLFALSTQVAVLAEQRIIVSGPPLAVTQHRHPFIQEFFMGPRGRRLTQAMLEGGSAGSGVDQT